MTDLKRMRLLCGLRQIDLWAATGIPIQRLSLAERGLLELTEGERRLLVSFLRDRWESTQCGKAGGGCEVQQAVKPRYAQ